MLVTYGWQYCIPHNLLGTICFRIVDISFISRVNIIWVQGVSRFVENIAMWFTTATMHRSLAWIFRHRWLIQGVAAKCPLDLLYGHQTRSKLCCSSMYVQTFMARLCWDSNLFYKLSDRQPMVYMHYILDLLNATIKSLSGRGSFLINQVNHFYHYIQPRVSHSQACFKRWNVASLLPWIAHCA